MGVKELKQIIEEHGLAHADCLEEGLLRERAREAIGADTSPGPANSAGSGAAYAKAARAARVVVGSEDVAAADAAPSNTTAPVPSPPAQAMGIETASVKELKRIIEEHGLSHADCIEKAELKARALAAIGVHNTTMPARQGRVYGQAGS